MAIYPCDTSNRFYNAANRLKMKISYEAHDFHAADIYYRNSCYTKFALKSLSTTAAEEQNVLKLNVFKEFCLQIQKCIICGKETFLLSDLLEDIKRLCEENGIEEFIITYSRTLKRKIIGTFYQLTTSIKVIKTIVRIN